MVSNVFVKSCEALSYDRLSLLWLDMDFIDQSFLFIYYFLNVHNQYVIFSAISTGIEINSMCYSFNLTLLFLFKDRHLLSSGFSE